MPRALPTHRIAERHEVDGGDDEVLLARKVAVHCVGKL